MPEGWKALKDDTKVLILIFTSQHKSKYEIVLLKADNTDYLSKKVDKRISQKVMEN